jgi:hypothetical protein
MPSRRSPIYSLYKETDMPIEGLSTRDVIQPRFRTLGKLRKGGEKTGNRPGRDLDYFRFVPDNGRADIRAAFVSAYGEKPERLEIYFPFPTMEENFRSWREDYGANHLCKLRCDGARWHDWIQGDRHYHDEEGRECELKYRDTPNRCPQCPLGYYGYLDVILPLMWENGQIGLVTILTTSINDIARLSAKLVQWEPLNNKPFLVWREIKTIGIPINGKRVAKDVSLIHLELTEEQMVRAFLSAREAPALLPEASSNGDVHTGTPPDLDYDGELIGDDPFLMDGSHGAPMDASAREDLREDEIAQEELERNLPRDLGSGLVADLNYVPMWIDTEEPRQWGRLYFEARQHLGYANDQHVQGALKRNVPDDDERAALSYRAAWHLLQEHQRSKQAD